MVEMVEVVRRGGEGEGERGGGGRVVKVLAP